MGHLRCLVLSTLISAFLPTIVWGGSPRVMVELAFVFRGEPADATLDLREEFEKALPQAEHAQEGLLPFLDNWLRGKDRDQHEIDLMQVKIPLGEEVEFVTRHSLTSKFDDPKAMFEAAGIPMMPGEDLLSDGLEATVRADQTEDGKIRVRFRLDKRMPATSMPNDKSDDPNAPPLPLLHRRGVNTAVDLEPGQAIELSGLHANAEKGKPRAKELAVLVRVQLADPAPFPAD